MIARLPVMPEQILPSRPRPRSRVNPRHAPGHPGARTVGDHVPALLALHAEVRAPPPARVHRLEQVEPQEVIGDALEVEQPGERHVIDAPARQLGPDIALVIGADAPKPSVVNLRLRSVATGPPRLDRFDAPMRFASPSRKSPKIPRPPPCASAASATLAASPAFFGMRGSLP